MVRCFTAVVLAFVSLVSAQTAQAALKVGDPAPALTIAHWVKGAPFDLAKAPKGSVQVIEFWATWCSPCVMGIPHLSEMQEHFKDRNVTFIGVSDEKKETVEKFLGRGFDAKMRYTVAIDDAGKTNNAWLRAAGKSSIPCAFVVKDGKIEWIGHPMDGMDAKIAELVGDQNYAKRKAQLDALTQKIGAAAQAKKWDDVYTSMREYLAIAPDSIQHQIAMYHLLMVHLKKPADAKKHGAEIISTMTDIDGLNTLAWFIVKHDDFKDQRDLDLAHQAASKAMKLTQEESADVLDTYALVLAESGKVAEAIKYQEKAVAKCGDDEDPRMKRELMERLEEYKKRK